MPYLSHKRERNWWLDEWRTIVFFTGGRFCSRFVLLSFSVEYVEQQQGGRGLGLIHECPACTFGPIMEMGLKLLVADYLCNLSAHSCPTLCIIAHNSSRRNVWQPPGYSRRQQGVWGAKPFPPCFRAASLQLKLNFAAAPSCWHDLPAAAQAADNSSRAGGI